MNIFNILIGVVLLTAGRKLFWLFVGCIGFAVGFHYAPMLWGVESRALLLVLALVTGVIGAILAVFFQKFAIALAGFAAGGYIAINLMDLVGLQLGQFYWLPYIIGGIIGAVFLFLIFDWALIIVSSLAGASVIIQSVSLNPRVEFFAYFALAVLGAIIQIALFLRVSSIRER